MLPDPLSLIVVASLSLPQPTLLPPGTPVTRSSFRFASAAPPPASALTRSASLKPIRHPAAKKATAAVALGILGFFGGMLGGAAIGSLGPDDDAVLSGAFVGAISGAAGGALVGLLVAR